MILIYRDASVLPRPVFVRGGARGAVEKILAAWSLKSPGALDLVGTLNCPAICCIGSGPIYVYYELSPEMDLNAFYPALHDPLAWQFAGDASVGDGGDQGFDSAAGQGNVEPSVPVTEPVEAEVPKPKRSKKKRVASKDYRLRYDNRVFQYFHHLKLYYLLRDQHSNYLEVCCSVMTEAITVATTVAIPGDVSKDIGTERRSLAVEKNTLLEAKEMEIEDLKESLTSGKLTSAKDHNILLEQECDFFKAKNPEPVFVDQVHELEISSADLREKLEMYEGLLKRLEEFQDNLMGPYG
ncbi:hypothetical protein Tco_0588524 [Tanacetum coccineum]